MATTFNAIFLGTSSIVLDPTEGNTTAENAASFVGTTFGSLTNSLAGNWVSFTSVDRSGTAAILDQANATFRPDQATIVRNGVTSTYTFDATSVYTGVITYSNGTTSAPLEFVVVQMTNGNLYLVPSPTAGTPTNIALAADQVRAIQLTALVNNNYTGMNADRPVISFMTCFTRGTLLRGPDGVTPIERIKPGDLLDTADHGPQPVRWIGMRRLFADDISRNPNLAPITIRAGALGMGLPLRDLTVSPQHRVLVRSPIVTRMAGQSEALVAAKHLLGAPGIEIASPSPRVEYWHVLFDRHEVIFAEGAPTESLYLGAQAVKSMTADALQEIAQIYPQLFSTGGQVMPPAGSRKFLSGKPARTMTQRHILNRKPLLHPHRQVAGHAAMFEYCNY